MKPSALRLDQHFRFIPEEITNRKEEMKKELKEKSCTNFIQISQAFQRTFHRKCQA